MAVKKMRPTTPAQRGMTSQDFDQITTKKPVKSLRFIRIVEFNPAAGLTATVEHIEYDPGRSARIARLRDEKGNLSYTIATSGMHQGQVVRVAADDQKVAIENGNRMKLRDIPLGATIHNIEITAGRGGQAVRAAGASAQLTAKEGDYAMVRMPSGEVRKFHLECMATLWLAMNSIRISRLVLLVASATWVFDRTSVVLT